ncbi:hypothetical protein ACFYP6_18485 [Streptomyces goshikiensis]|uniref:hypothetical protein n=1 Tax=Streptomyces goshikiensis TaxID=1942 RepID=UPI0036B25BC7
MLKLAKNSQPERSVGAELWDHGALAQAADEGYKLAYDTAVDLLKTQTATLDTLRTRAAGLLSVAALVTTFASGVGLLNADPSKGATLARWAPWSLFGVLFSIGCLVIFVLFPQGWGFGPAPNRIWELLHGGEELSEIRRYVTEKMLETVGNNDRKIRWRANAYRLATFGLLAEVIILVIALATQPAATS